MYAGARNNNMQWGIAVLISRVDIRSGVYQGADKALIEWIASTGGKQRCYPVSVYAVRICTTIEEQFDNTKIMTFSRNM